MGMIRRLFGRRRRDPVKPGTYSVLVASEGRRFTQEAIDLAERLARDKGGQVRVITVARLWGSSFGLPNPGLRPTRREMAEQQENVAWAIERLEERGLSADGHIVVTRDACNSILREVKRLGCEAIVMHADPRRPALIGSFMWSQAPYRIKRRAPVPLHLVGLPTHS